MSVLETSWDICTLCIYVEKILLRLQICWVNRIKKVCPAKQIEVLFVVWKILLQLIVLISLGIGTYFIDVWQQTHQTKSIYLVFLLFWCINCGHYVPSNFCKYFSLIMGKLHWVWNKKITWWEKIFCRSIIRWLKKRRIDLIQTLTIETFYFRQKIVYKCEVIIADMGFW